MALGAAVISKCKDCKELERSGGMLRWVGNAFSTDSTMLKDWRRREEARMVWTSQAATPVPMSSRCCNEAEIVGSDK